VPGAAAAPGTACPRLPRRRVLAAALAVLTVTSSGDAFPARYLIVFAMAGVIAVTLLVQAPLLPRVVRWARLPADNGAETEWRRAYRTATEQALRALPRLAAGRGIRPEVTESLRGEYDRLLRLQDGLDTEAVHLDRDRPPEPE
jgi:hypothetical protein